MSVVEVMGGERIGYVRRALRVREYNSEWALSGLRCS